MPTARVSISLPPGGTDRSYDVLIQDGLLDELGAGSQPLPAASSYFIVTDSKVSRLYGRRLLASISDLHPKVGLVAFPAGEANKNIETASTIASRLGSLGADRRSVVLALGGGVVGDLAGFVSSVYMRGIEYVQIPTTLLAQVDSSIGGKTGVDTPWGKNQLGTFHQPRAVLTDPQTLRTLPPQEMTNGAAEMAKCAIVASRGMFERMSALREFDQETLREFIVDACRVKAHVVSEDEEESNLRAVLNFGHTVGHAIESASDYSLGHGASVLLGMMAESWIAHDLGLLGGDDFARISDLLRLISGRAAISAGVMDVKKIARFARADKKALSSTLRMSLPVEVGKMHVTKDGSYLTPIPQEVFVESIRRLPELFPGH